MRKLTVKRAIATVAIAGIASVSGLACTSTTTSPAKPPASPTAPAPVHLTMTGEEVKEEVTGSVAADGTTATKVQVLGTPTEANGTEVARLIVWFDDGTAYNQTFTLDTQSGDWTTDTGAQYFGEG